MTAHLDRSENAWDGYSPLAWALANTAKMHVRGDGNILAEVVLRPWGQTIVAVGSTSGAAIRELAHDLERWNDRAVR